ncbi:hypothetical protein [Ulvibacterium marinum]|uniref:hypothetical protein n=1 Tax=Ulvibacterium marinum TaxID=2419782 RepID=UPI0024941085|nr:hypothetical protein [Ulvibacterium marinum]
MKICIFRIMDEKRIEEIVRKVFQKAKEGHASHSRFALSNHISGQSDLSSKTLERAYDRYIDKKKKHGPPNAESIDLLCRYLMYEDYKDYVEKNPIKGIGREWRLVVIMGVAFGAILATILTLRNQVFPSYDDSSSNIENKDGFIKKNIDKQLIDKNCMTWSDSLYVRISCDTGPFSKYGTDVKPLNQMELKNMRKVEVDAAYPFFSEDGKPLIWYYRNKDSEHEFFTAPGLHPVNGETLRKITPYIIQTYVPIHSKKENSFIKQ